MSRDRKTQKQVLVNPAFKRKFDFVSFSEKNEGIKREDPNPLYTHTSCPFLFLVCFCSIGSLGSHNSRACVSNITVSNSVIKHSDNGVRIKTWQGGEGAVTKVTFNNIHMDTVRNPIIIDQYYCLFKNCINQSTAVSVSHVSYSNIRGTYDVRSPPMSFACSDSVPCTNLTLSEVILLPAQGYILATPFCWNAYGTMQTLTIPPVLCFLDGNPLTLPQDDVVWC